MALIDILKGRKREEVKPERLPKGALKQIEKPAKKREEIKFADQRAKEKAGKAKDASKASLDKENSEVKKEKSIKTKQSLLASKFLLRPHITEQSTALADKNIYTFRVSPSANKIIVKKSIKEMYGFDPIKIRVINVPSKKRTVRGKIGIKPGFKKALVYLKEGDKIEFI